MPATKKKRNLFGFGKKTTHSTRIVREAYAAGRRSADTAQFHDWWSKQFRSGPKPSGSLRRRAEKRYRAGVESLWTESPKTPRPVSKREPRGLNQVQSDAVSALVNLGVKKGEATERVKAAYRKGDTLTDMIRKTSAKNSKKKNAADPLGDQIDKLLRSIYAMQDPMQKERLTHGKTPKYHRASKAYMNKIRLIERLQKEYRVREGIENPKRFDKCVAEVKASLKKQRRPGNAYAICTAAVTKNKKARNQNEALEYTEKNIRIKIQPSARRKGQWDLFVNGILRITKPTRKGAEGYAKRIIASNPKRSANSPKKPTGHIRQGSAEATIEKRGLIGANKFHVTVKAPGKPVAQKSFGTLAGALAYARLKVHEMAENPDPALDLIPGGSTVAAYGRAGRRVLKGVTKLGKQTLKKVKGFATGKRRKNPIDLAQQRVEEFTGFPSTEIMELSERKHVHSNLAGLAQFVAFNLIDADGKELPPLIAPGMKYTGNLKEILFSFKGNPTGDWDFDSGTPADKIVWLTASEKTDYKVDGKPLEVKQQLYLSGGDQSLDEKGRRYLRIEPRDLHDNTFVGTIVRVWYWTRKTFESKGKEKVWFFHDFGKEGSMGRCPVLIYHPLDPSFEIAGGRYYVALPRKDLKGVRGGPVSPGIVG